MCTAASGKSSEGDLGQTLPGRVLALAPLTAPASVDGPSACAAASLSRHRPPAGPLLPFLQHLWRTHTVLATRAASVKTQRNACLPGTNFQGQVRHGRKTEKARGLIESPSGTVAQAAALRTSRVPGSHWEVSLNKGRSGEGVSPGCLQRAGAEGRGRPLGPGEREQLGGTAVWELGSVGPGSPLRQLHTGVGGSPHVLPDFLLPSTVLDASQQPPQAVLLPGIF